MSIGLKILATLMTLGALALVTLIVLASLEMSLMDGLRSVWSTLWGVTTLVDLGVGFALAGAWIVCVERSVVKRIAWIAGMCLTGNLAVAAFAMLRARRCATLGEFFGGAPAGVTAGPDRGTDSGG